MSTSWLHDQIVAAEVPHHAAEQISRSNWTLSACVLPCIVGSLSIHWWFIVIQCTCCEPPLSSPIGYHRRLRGGREAQISRKLGMVSQGDGPQASSMLSALACRENHWLRAVPMW